MENKLGIKRKSLRRVVTNAILLGAFIILLLAVIVEMVLFAYPTLENYKREMNHEGRYAAALIGDEYLESIYARTKEVYFRIPDEEKADMYSEEYINNFIPLIDEDFHAARKVLTTCREQAQMSNVYFTFFDESNERLVYVIDGNERDKAFLPGQYISDENGMIESMKTINRVLESNWYVPLSYGRDYGWEATDYIGLYDENGSLYGYMTINISVNAFARQILVFLAIYVPVMLIGLLIFARFASKAVYKRVIHPINSLATAAREYMDTGKGDEIKNTKIFKRFKITTNDELEDLWDTMVEMEDDIQKAMIKIKESTAKEERITAELELARNIQESALPNVFPAFPEDKRFDIYASMTPAKEVGGDFYDFFKIDEDHLCMLIADVSGKGIPAALFMMICKSLIKNRAMQGGKPSEILSSVNDSIADENLNDMFVTVWLGILDIRSGEMIASNAGHEYPFITGENGEFMLYKEPHGVVIGVLSNMEYEDYELTIPKGGSFFAYTDGVAEAQDKNEEFYGLIRLNESLNKAVSDAPDKLIANVKNDVDEFESGVEQFDDITMLSIKYLG